MQIPGKWTLKLKKLDGDRVEADFKGQTVTVDDDPGATAIALKIRDFKLLLDAFIKSGEEEKTFVLNQYQADQERFFDVNSPS